MTPDPDAEPYPEQRPPEQRPADPAALGADMDRMKAAADAVVAAQREALAAGGKPEELFEQGARQIFAAMPPTFGPANAWLFNERSGKLGALEQALGLTEAEWCHAFLLELQAEEQG